MKFTLSQNRLKTLLHHRHILLMSLGVSGALNLMLGVSILFKSDHVIIMPPELKQSFWVERNQVSATYLEEMSVFLASFILDVTPESAAYRREVLLRYVTPERYSALKAQLLQEEERLKKETLSTTFTPIECQVDRSHLTVQIKGDLQSYVGSKKITEQRETYLLSFSLKGGRLYLHSFTYKETPSHG